MLTISVIGVAFVYVFTSFDRRVWCRLKMLFTVEIKPSETSANDSSKENGAPLLTKIQLTWINIVGHTTSSNVRKVRATSRS